MTFEIHITPTEGSWRATWSVGAKLATLGLTASATGFSCTADSYGKAVKKTAEIIRAIDQEKVSWKIKEIVLDSGTGDVLPSVV